MKRLCFVLAIALLAGALFAGSQAEIVKQEMTLTMGVFGDLESAYTKVRDSDSFKKKFPKLTLKFQSSDFGGHHDRLITQIAAGVGANDIEALEIGYIARFVREGGFTNLAMKEFDGKKSRKRSC